MNKDWTGYPFGGYDGSDESFERLQDQAPWSRPDADVIGDLRAVGRASSEWPQAAPYVKRAPKWHATEEAAPVTVVSDQGGETVEIPTVSCRRCQAEIHLLGGAQVGQVADDTPWVDWAEHVLCSGTSEPHTPQWSKAQMERDFEVREFELGLCVVIRRADGKLGSLRFDHAPRFYFAWQEHTP